MKRFIFLLGFLLVGLFGLHHEAFALTVQPSVIDDISLNPGESVTRSVKITNTSDSQLTLKPQFYDAEAGTGSNGAISFSPKNQSSTLANWMSVNTDQVVLQPSESKEVPLYIATPSSAPAGGHYALLVWQDVGTSLSGSGASVVGGVAVNVAVDIKGTVTESGEIISFYTKDKLKNYNRLPVSFEVAVHNSGTRHFKPTGVIRVTNMFGRTVATLPINQEGLAGGNVLPKGTQTFGATWEGEFAFGKYSALLDLTLGGAGKKTAQYELWFMPTGLLVLWLIIALIIIVILVLLIKRALQSSANLKK